MSTVAVAKREDTRNLAWRADNVGSKLLQRMGWKDGQAVGKRQRSLDSSYAESEAGDSEKVSSEGIRVVKRKDGLGLGAKSSSLYEADQHHHVGHFSNLLTELQKHHGVDSKKKKKKSSKKTISPLTLPTNKSTHHKIRQAKFVEKSEHDMKCIFGGSIDFPVFATVEGTTSNEKESKKRKKEKVDKERNDKKKKRKKESS
jgi:hypothetical protein